MHRKDNTEQVDTGPYDGQQSQHISSLSLVKVFFRFYFKKCFKGVGVELEEG